MKIQSPKRILTTDFAEDDKEVAGKIGGLINTFNEEIHQALSKNLTIQDNLDQAVKVITISVDLTGKPTTSLSFQSPLKGRLQGTQVIRAIGNNYPNSQPFISYSEASGVVTILNVSGLPANTQYQLVVLLIGQ